MNKITLIMLFSLLTTHHNHIKPGLIKSAAIIAITAAVTIFLYKQYQESQKSDLEKALNKRIDTFKDAANEVKNLIKK